MGVPGNIIARVAAQLERNIPLSGPILLCLPDILEGECDCRGGDTEGLTTRAEGGCEGGNADKLFDAGC